MPLSSKTATCQCELHKTPLRIKILYDEREVKRLKRRFDNKYLQIGKACWSTKKIGHLSRRRLVAQLQIGKYQFYYAFFA